MRKIRYKPKGLPNIADSDWPDYLTSLMKDKRGVWQKTINIPEVTKKLQQYYIWSNPEDLSRKKRWEEVSVIQLEKPLCVRNYGHVYKPFKPKDPSKDNKKFKYALIKKMESDDQITKDNVRLHLVPQFSRINIGDYVEGCGSNVVNRHSSSIFQIMTGELDHRLGGSGNKSQPPPSSRRQSLNTSLGDMSMTSSPAPPREEDSTFTMDAFWADLGVDIPPPADSGSRRNSQGGENNNDDAGGDMDIDDDDDFEL